jgi:broad specificity phosphatase PhoE/8-oxo-dGTP pyrophosphatase MutT (NUDIX family)
MKTTLYLIRHGETVWNVEGRFQGHKDSPLTSLGERQARWLRMALKDIEFDAIYSSTSPRAYRTADIIRGKREVAIETSDRLMEIHLGCWEGKPRTEIENIFPEDHHLFWSAPHAYVPSNGGESFPQLQNRVIQEMKDIIWKHRDGNVLIVTHAIALKAIMAWFKGDPLENLWSPPIIQPTALNKVVIEGDDACSIELYGDISHYQTVRKAVGAIAYQGNRFILVHKVSNTPSGVSGIWDFPKGGVEEDDVCLENAVLRELLEETGSDQYIIKEELPEKITFEFDDELRKRIGYDRQETRMFLVEFLGNPADLKPRDNEIDEVTLVEVEYLLSKLSHAETAEYVRRYCGI